MSAAPLWPFAVALAFGVCSVTAFGADQPAAVSPQVGAENWGPYCGVHCLYAALDAIGMDVDLEELVSAKYIGSFAGSSAAELERAASDFGAHAMTMNRLTADMLRVSPHPVILHVWPNLRSTAYSHWVLFLGMEDGKARILDSPKPVELVPLADVLARWDGTGVLIASEPPATATFTWLACATFLGMASIALCAILLVRARRRAPRRQSLGRDFLGVAQIAAISVVTGLLWHSVCPDGFFLNGSAVASVVANFHSSFVPRLTAAELRTLLHDDGAVLVDARRSQDYRRGHIDGAINVPVSASLAERERALEGVPTSARIVLYCQSEGCQWASELANVLAASGYKNLSLYPGGWREWSQAIQRDQALPQAERDN